MTVARIVIAATDKTAPAFKSASAGLADLQRRAAGIGTAFAGLAPQLAAAFSVGAVTGFVRSTINAIDALNDVADATGSSIENVSALEDVARRTGRTLDDVGSILLKFNEALAAADGKNQVSQVLQAIGLDAKRLRELDPAEALQRAAQALAGFADDGNKARAVYALFGKSIRDAAPFLKDLVDAGKLNGSVTSDQAEAAARFNKQLAALSTNAADAGRSITTFILPTLNTGLGRLAAWTKELQDIRGLLIQIATFSPAGALGRSFQANFGTDPQRELERLTKLVGDYQRAVDAGDRRPQLLAELATARAALAGVQARLPLPASYSNEGRNYPTPRLPDLSGSRPPAPRAPAMASLRTMAPNIFDDREYLKLVGDLGDELGRLAALDDLPFVRDFERLNELLQQTPSAELERTRRDMELLAAAFTEGRIGVEEYTEAVQTRLGTLPEKVKPALDEMSEFAKQFERNIQDSMGETIKRTLAGDFKSIGRLWGDLLLDMAAQAIAVDLGNKLFPKGGGGLMSFLGGLFGFAKGAPFANGLPVTAFAAGGVVTGPSVFPMRGSLGLMGEAGPEAIMPLKRGRDGRLGVEGGGGTVINHYHVAAGITRNELVTALQVMQAGIEARTTVALRRGGVQ